MKDGQYEKRGFLQEDFRLFHIKDSSLESIDYHYHAFHKIYILLSGNVIYNVEGKSYPLLPYDMVLIPRNELHKPEIDFSTPYERIILYINLQEDSLLSHCFERSSETGQHVIRLTNTPHMRLFEVLAALEEASASVDFAGELYESALFTEFMVLLNRSMIHNQYSYVSSHSSDNKIHRILSYINQHLRDDLSVDFLSAHFYISKYHLMRTFKTETGYSLHNYITDKRLLLAKELLTREFSVGEICFQCGFKDYSTFFRAFKKKYSCKPSQFKRSEKSEL